jgi:hypothetical protein
LIAKEGRPFVQAIHDPQKICKLALDILHTPEMHRKHDYVPGFFRNEYSAEPDKLEIYNKWTAFLMECDWYKQYITPGERAGLIF